MAKLLSVFVVCSICCATATTTTTTTTIAPAPVTTTTTLPYAVPAGYNASHNQECDTKDGKIAFGTKLQDNAITFEKSADLQKAINACAFECNLVKGCGFFAIRTEGSSLGRCVVYPKCLKLKVSQGTAVFQLIAGQNAAATKLTACNANVPGLAAATAAVGYCAYPTQDMGGSPSKELFATGMGTVATCAAACTAKGVTVCDGFNFETAGVTKGRCVGKMTGSPATNRATMVYYKRLSGAVAIANATAGSALAGAFRGRGATAVALTALASCVLHQTF